MGIKLQYAEGATPLNPDEADGLIPSHIATQGQLNAWELQNIRQAEEWAFDRKHKEILTVDFMQSIHKKMFCDTWKWAGTIRRTEKNIGVAPEKIYVSLHNLCEDVGAQIEYKSMPIREICARFHHKLVFIHPFPNGNGRFSRTMTDLLLVHHSEAVFSWGDLLEDGDVRKKYISALREADGKNYQPLLQFLGVG